MSMIDISVCIPTFNRKEYLERAIISVQHQLENNDEIIIRDNCSTDGTSEMVKKYTSANSRIKYFRNDTNIGPALNFVEVIESATNEHIYLLTDDDYLLTDALKKVKNFFANSNARIFKTAFFTFNEKSKTGELISYFKSNVGATQVSIDEAVTIYTSAH